MGFWRQVFQSVFGNAGGLPNDEARLDARLDRRLPGMWVVSARGGLLPRYGLYHGQDMRTVVSGGIVYSARWMSSKPIKEKSSGTLRLASKTAC